MRIFQKMEAWATAYRDMMLMTNSDGDRSGYGYSGYGRSFGKYIEDYMAEKGYEQYNNGMKLPLYVDGKPVLRIDMLTVTEADFFLSDYSNLAAGFRADYDVAVYKAHSYEYKEFCALRCPHRSAALESGTNVSAGEDNRSFRG